MIKLIATSFILLVTASFNYAQTSIDSVRMTEFRYTTSSSGDSLTYKSHQQIEKYTAQNTSFEEWEYLPDASVSSYHYRYKSIPGLQQIAVFWEAKDRDGFALTEACFEHYQPQLKRYVLLEMTHRSRHYPAGSLYAYDTTIVSNAFYLKVSLLDSNQVFKQEYEFHNSNIAAQLASGLTGQTSYSPVMLYEFFMGQFLSTIEGHEYGYSYCETDEEYLLGIFDADPSFLFVKTDKRRPQILQEDYILLMREKNYERWEYAYGCKCGFMRCEVFRHTNP